MSDSNAAVDAQFDSRLLSLPAEIRREVYRYVVPPSIHIFTSPQGRLDVAACVEPLASPSSDDKCDIGGYLDGPLRRPRARYRDTDPAWVRCLRSSWGAHWACAEVACADERDQIGDLLSVCKRV